ncbi:Glutamyl-tRNA(Gln) amidotransferase subunit A [Tolypocladium ophioglossoides CBS 100239]|uniref:Glutamyl-tRNA(Gln) amidotransferase subunit A n=1 Tax=Tolypocladium ophioglossoides (strain CBS 100239) TaxID=1163406 RepID=A0A0L0NGL1_TOLOC|nr:Glutamyl-tRNA(Gln) amidotransferase subunit A [Tolypocladium ophioglossoides CBS 100239]
MKRPLSAVDPEVKIESIEGSEVIPDAGPSRSKAGKQKKVATKPSQLHQLTATEIRELIRSDKVTVEEYAWALIEQFEKRDDDVHAWAHYDTDLIIAEARRLDDVPASKRGQLHGVAVGIKDIFLTKDMPTRYYSPIHKNDGNAAADSAAVAIFRAAGALILGKTATTEFAAKTEGTKCCNPRDHHYSPGGSSSGSAAAVSDCQVPIAIGTQTGGSIVRPGSYTGTFAFKPTWGLISTEGMGRFSVSLDTAGFFARSVDDLDLLAKLFRLDLDYTRPRKPFTIKGAKIALIKTHVWDHASRSTQAAWKQARSLLVEAGAVLEDVELPGSFRKCHDWWGTLAAGEARSAFLSKYVQSTQKLHASLKAFVQNKNKPTRKEMLEVYDGVAQLRPQWDQIASKYDAIITPSTVDQAPKGLEDTGSAVFNIMWTLLHVPSLNVPGFFGYYNLPIGLTIVGGRFSDMEVLRAGKVIGTLFNKGKVDRGS